MGLLIHSAKVSNENGCFSSSSFRNFIMVIVEKIKIKAFKLPFLIIFGIFLMLAQLNLGVVRADEKNLDTENAREECIKGATVFCLAIGIAEEQSGNQEKALEYFRLACNNHPTLGHLRACAPLLSLAKDMGRLKEEALPLERICAEGKKITCFYLGKEYLKVNHIELAKKHLEPLCRSGYRPPDSDDYGPCYHLGKGFERIHDWDFAEQLYDYDCNRDRIQGKPSCEALNFLSDLINRTRKATWDRIRNFEPVEGILFILVAIPLLGMVFWWIGDQWGIRFVKFHAPGLVIVCWVVWEILPKESNYHPGDWILIFIAFEILLGLIFIPYLQRN